jgi:hypothetical protein
VALQVLGADRLLIPRVADDDVSQPFFQVIQRCGKAENRHHLGGDDDVEAVLARVAVGGAAQADGDVAQRAFIIAWVSGSEPADGPRYVWLEGIEDDPSSS